MDGVITAETVYYILGLFSYLEDTLNVIIPYGLSLGAEAFAVIERIETILLAEEVISNEFQNKIGENNRILLENLTVKIKETTILENVFLNISDSGLYLVVGNIGSGKSTFLKTLLEEYGTNDTTGSFKIIGSTSYASQEPWLFPSTIRNNILFGKNLNENRYQQILNICNLDYDIKLLPDGDMTIVGNCGISLSKGQQIRINLARAVYTEADIYLIDDSLASLDASVSDYIFQDCIKTFLKDKICLLVTNNINYVKKSKQVIVIKNKAVKIKENTEKQVTQVNIKCDKSNKCTKNNDAITEKIYNEHKKVGQVSWINYYKYISHGGGVTMLGLIIMLFLGLQVAISCSDKLVSQW